MIHEVSVRWFDHILNFIHYDNPGLPDCHQVGLLQPGNETQIPLYAYLADFPRHVLTRNLRSSAYELYARKSLSGTSKLSVLYIGIAFVIMILWLFPHESVDPCVTLGILFGWVILGQPILNLLARIISLLPMPTSQPKENAHVLPNHYKGTFSRTARVHFLGAWFVTTSNTSESVQAFAS